MSASDKAIADPSTGAAPATAVFQRISWRHIAYFLGVPLTVAVYAALNNWEIRQTAGVWASLAFYLAHALLPWWTTCLSTTLVMRALSRWKPPWLLLLLLGHMVGSMLVLPYSNWLTGLYEELWPALELAGEFAPVFSTGFWLYLVRAGIIWLGINFLFDRFFGLPLYRYSIPRGYDAEQSDREESHGAANPDAWSGHVPGFIGQLPVQLLPAEVLAIKAEQHYIRIITPGKQYMVLYRFRDAVNELESIPGQQVHRSYWVSSAAISKVNAKVKDFYLTLSNGEQVPVSGPYQGMVRELARSARISVQA